MAEKTKKGLFSKVKWVKPYYKDLQNRIINRVGVLMAILVAVAVALAYMDQAEWASRSFMAVILLVGVATGSAMAIQTINKHDEAEIAGTNEKNKKG